MSSLRVALSKWRPWSSSSNSSSSSCEYHQLQLSPVPLDCLPPFLSSSKKLKSPVPVIAGNHPQHRQIFFVQPHILNHWLFQDLLNKSRSQTQWAVLDWEEVDSFAARSKKLGDSAPQPVWLDCDAILFEFLLWLVQNDDPSLRDLNLNDLMEFYDAES